MPASECVQYKLDTVLSIFLGIITNIIIWNYLSQPSIKIIEENQIVNNKKNI
jgi:hypothetical protein